MQRQNDQNYQYRALESGNGPKPNFKLPYVLPYAILLLFNAILYGVNYLYSDLENGAWSPYIFSVQPQNLKHRPYGVTVYVLNTVSALIFLSFMMMRGHQKSVRTEKGMIARWFLHLIAISLIVVIWILNANQLWVYKISLNNIAFNSNWVQPLYTVLYSISIAYGILLAFPASIYLLYRYFIKTQDNYKINRQAVQYHKTFNKICYFATFISIIIIVALNLSYLGDYETYLVSTVYVLYPFFPNIQTEMLLPVLYTEYILSGIAMVFAVFLLIKQIFDTMKNRRKHIKRQMLTLTAVMFLINVLTINRFIQVNRYQKVISIVKYQPTQPFLDLYYHLRVIMWCYIFLLFPLNIYSIRNFWLEWKNEFAEGAEQSELKSSRFQVEALNNSNPNYYPNYYPNHQNRPIQNNAGSEQFRRQPVQERRVVHVPRNQEAVVERRQPSVRQRNINQIQAVIKDQSSAFKQQPKPKMNVSGKPQVQSEIQADLKVSI